MKVYKFGGASVKNAEGIKNLADIVSGEKENLVIVISALGKTTNALEQVLKAWISEDKSYLTLLHSVYENHHSIIAELFIGNNAASEKLDIAYARLCEYLSSREKSDFDFEYDQVVSYGEIWSTIIVAEYLKSQHFDAEWVDIRDILLTDDRYRDANVMWSESSRRVRLKFDFSRKRIYITQGFIGGTITGSTTTLGREGSDYSAAILANILDAEVVIVWKDVPGILNADPKWLPDSMKLDEVSYKEAVEITFSGAKVIHPKTIKPLHNKNIPLNVRSFLEPAEPGTMIKADTTIRHRIPVFIKKETQILISILPKDFSFVIGDNLGRIFHSFMKHGIKVNLVEASAVSLDVCIDDERFKVNSLIEELKHEFSSIYNEDVELLSIRNYTGESIEKITKGRDILLEQRTRSTVRFVVKATLQ